MLVREPARKALAVALPGRDKRLYNYIRLVYRWGKRTPRVPEQTRGGDGPPHLATVDIERRDDPKVVDLISAYPWMDQPGGVRGVRVPIVLDALQQRARTVSNTRDGYSHLGQFKSPFSSTSRVFDADSQSGCSYSSPRHAGRRPTQSEPAQFTRDS